MQAEQLVKEGRLDDALKALTESVRNDPSKAEYRAFLYQLLCVMGQWDRALTQINVVGELEPKNLLMVEVYRNAIHAEALRREVFAGRRTPLMLGEPDEWVGWLVQAQKLLAEGKPEAARDLRDRAFDAAPGVSGSIDGTPFEWIADADNRLGPILEAMIQGKYYWVPFDHVAAIEIEPPSSLRDVVWAQAQFTWSNQGKAVGLIPVRYAGTADKPDEAAKLSRRTGFEEPVEGYAVGVGQRMWATDKGEYPILQTRSILLGAAVEAGGAAAAGGAADG